MKKYLLLILVMGLFSHVFGQYNETIRSGRPGQSIGPYTVGKNIFQVQSGYEYSESETPFSLNKSNDVSTVLRYGTSEQVEISAAFNYQRSEFTNQFYEQISGGLSQLDVGFRANNLNNKSVKPSVGMQYRLKIPSPSDAFRTKYPSSVATLVTGQRFFDKLGFVTNWGLTWNGINGDYVAFYVFNLNTDITDKLGVFAELYGTKVNDNITGKVDGGFAYLVNNNLQLDLLGGWGTFMDSNSDDFFVGLGVSWRTKRNNN